MSNFIQKRLEHIEDKLEDLIYYANLTLRKCNHCGSYHSSDLASIKAANDLEKMLEQIRAFKNEAWALQVRNV